MEQSNIQYYFTFEHRTDLEVHTSYTVWVNDTAVLTVPYDPFNNVVGPVEFNEPVQGVFARVSGGGKAPVSRKVDLSGGSTTTPLPGSGFAVGVTMSGDSTAGVPTTFVIVLYQLPQ
jgi:hypothetical protein